MSRESEYESCIELTPREVAQVEQALAADPAEVEALVRLALRCG